VLFSIVAYDKPNGLAHRMAVRPEHLAHLDSLGDKLVLAGPFLDAEGNMNGSFMVIEAADQAEAEATFGRDPFVVQGVFGAMEIRPFRIGVNNTKK